MSPKQSLDRLLAITRVHYYKPIQIAEILYRNRIKPFDLSDLKNYRTVSKKWRDEVSYRLVGSVSTSSSRFQDNLFEENALSPKSILELAKINNSNGGMVEAYIYLSMRKKFNSVYKIFEYLEDANMSNFNFESLYNLFVKDPGLHRSMDKVFEITSYSLFDVLLNILEVKVTLSIQEEKSKLLDDFEKFIVNVLDLKPNETNKVTKAKVYRVGATNANDGGLDMWANYGPAIQIKHIGINAGNVINVVGSVTSDAKLIIICKDSEANVIDSLVNQIGVGHHVQSIITYTDIAEWYDLCFSDKYRGTVGLNILERMKVEFNNEFPVNNELPEFLNERGYLDVVMKDDWQINQS
jgi:hypothetical protein